MKSSSSTSSRTDNKEAPLIVTISGDLGSGKSMLANALVERWQADRYSTGMAQRRLAEKLGITTLELNQRAESDPSIDDQIDGVFRNLAKTPKNLIVDSRMAWHFLPLSFKIKLEVHPKVAATRVSGDKTRFSEGAYSSVEDIMAALKARKTSERERFQRYYNVDIEDQANYDLIINTTEAPPEAVVDITHDCLQVWRQRHPHERVWMAPKYLLPPAKLPDLDVASIEKRKVGWPAPGHWPEGLVEVARVQGHHVVLNNLETVAAGLSGGKPLIPVILSHTDPKPALPDAATLAAWQERFGFIYNSL